jgi:hypothetical protein
VLMSPSDIAAHVSGGEKGARNGGGGFSGVGKRAGEFS